MLFIAVIKKANNIIAFKRFLMFLPLLIIVKFPFEIISGVIAGLICKAYFATQMKRKLEGYQNDIIKSHQKIIELEELNAKLERRVKELEEYFSKDSISMN